MSKIEEMAKEYADKHGFRVPYDGSDNFYDEVDVKASKEGYIAGANAVLSEIEEFIKSKEMNGYNYIFCEVLKDKIKRLEGE